MPATERIDSAVGIAAPLPPPLVNAENIPGELKQLDQWVIWKLEGRDGKTTKVPFDTSNGRHAKTSDASTWSNFEMSHIGWDTSQGDGVGFVFSVDDPYFGVDLDHCRNPQTGELETWAMEIISRLNTYTEISPSGTGIHCIGRGKLPGGRSRKGSIEMYDSGRYFTMTGNQLEGTPPTVADCQTGLEQIHQEVFGASDQQSFDNDESYQPQNEPLVDDDHIINQAGQAANGEKFEQLYRGHWKSLGYPSHSEADAALASVLAFWTNRNPEQMDRLFRQSALIRSKWDELRGKLTYGQMTINHAIENCTETYSPDLLNELPPEWVYGYEEPKSNGNQKTPDQEDSRPWVQIPGENFPLLDCIAQIKQPVKEKLEWYQRDGDVVTPRDGKIVDVDDTEVPSELEKAVRLFIFRKKEIDGKSTQVKVPKPISRECSRLLVKAPEFWTSLPKIESVATVPLPHIRDGKLRIPSPGYDPELKIYTFYDGPIPAPAPIPEAKKMLDEILDDFCFCDDGERGSREANKTNAIAAMLTLFCTKLHDGLTPGFMVEGNQPGIGKGYLIEVICVPVLGEEPPAYSWNNDEQENRKRLLSVAKDARITYWIDDIAGYIKSSSLNMALTAKYIEDRILGKSGTGCYPWKAVTFLTGNNYKIATDLARRIIPIHLHLSREDIDNREYSKPDLVAWIKMNRSAVLGALYGLVQNWYLCGMPQCDQRMASYDQWVGTIGGILEAAGYVGFLEGRKSIATQSDLETSDMRILFQAWYERHSEAAVSTAEILLILGENELFSYILERNERSSVTRLGRLLEKWVEREMDNFLLLRVGKKRPAQYRLVRQNPIFDLPDHHNDLNVPQPVDDEHRQLQEVINETLGITN